MNGTVYLVFAGDCYYPLGGARDFRGAYPGLEEAKASVDLGKVGLQWVHVARLAGGCLVEVCNNGGGGMEVGKGVWIDEPDV